MYELWQWTKHHLPYYLHTCSSALCSYTVLQVFYESLSDCPQYAGNRDWMHTFQGHYIRIKLETTGAASTVHLLLFFFIY